MLLEFFSSGLVSLWLTTAGVKPPAVALAALHDTPWAVAIPGTTDATAEAIVQRYLQGLTQKGLTSTTQGIWLQSGPMLLSSNQGNTPLPAASLTKVATTLVALHTWDLQHRFETLISTTGTIKQGVLQGDLVIQGGADPMMVWEEAFAIGQALERLGIKKVTGNLVIAGTFLMNFETDPHQAAELFKQALDAREWLEDAQYIYHTLPPNSPRPQVEIAGTIQVIPPGQALTAPQTLLLRHYSPPLVQILKVMNVDSNNEISETLATLAGGGTAVADRAAELANAPRSEILLANGSGLGVENRLSPRAVCAMFAAIQRYLQAQNLTIADLFPISGIDGGTLDYRQIPKAAVVKTGTLNEVSALAGVVPTRDRGLVWFTIINRGSDIEDLRQQQDIFLQTLLKQWGTVTTAPIAISPTLPNTPPAITATSRNEVLLRSAVQATSTSE
ncbi:D-alanyl-D-alanine carboxypeptidase [Pantanalinema rosaneae CENA516]|uniref:D-alanyl-D-alanine carboxypeptidase n=1 Tax=Pantanalinema rosaneae TaxID=1620701 RepID=UPI003D6FA3CC